MSEQKGIDDLLSQGETPDVGRGATALRVIRDAEDVARAGRGDSRPSIITGTEEREVNDRAVDALARDPDVFVRGEVLVRVVRVPAGEYDHLTFADNAPRLRQLEEPTLREILSSVATWLGPAKGPKGKGKLVPAHPPAWCVKAVAARGSWPGLRPIAGVVESPALRPDGSILDRPGYDAATGLLYEPGAAFPAIPARPSRADAARAALDLLELVREFDFAGEAHRHVWLAAVLTLLARAAVAGPCPLFLFEASAAGSGKSLLARLVGIIGTGREPPCSGLSDKNDEVRKTITAIALAGERLVWFDNAAGAFGCAALDEALTAVTWKDRILGASECTPTLPLEAVWLATGNNLRLRGDLHRRILPCRLEPACERPEERGGYRIADLVGHTRAHRASLVAAGLTVLRGYFAAGKPQAPLAHFGTFEAWSNLVRQAIHWACGVDVYEARQAILPESRGESVSLAAVLEGWSGLPGGGEPPGITLAEAVKAVKTEAAHAALRELLTEWLGGKKDEQLTAAAVGYKLRDARGKVAGGRRLCRGADRHAKVATWYVEPIPAAGDACDAGDNSQATHAVIPSDGMSEENKKCGGCELSPASHASPAGDEYAWLDALPRQP